MKKPNFFIVGAPKAGTTSLHAILNQHPEVFMSEPKEVNFFSHKELVEQSIYYEPFTIGDIDRYMELFNEAKPTHSIIGEASVSYLYYEQVPARIHAFNPNAKILISLRNPIARAFSHYLMDKRLGYVKLSFEEIVGAALNGETNLYVQQYILLGNYYQQIKRYTDLFPADQVKIIFAKDLKREPDLTLKEVFRFLNITPQKKISTQNQNVHLDPKNEVLGELYANKRFRKISKFFLSDNMRKMFKKKFFKPGMKPSISPVIRDQLANYYQEEITKLVQHMSIDPSKLDS